MRYLSVFCGVISALLVCVHGGMSTQRLKGWEATPNSKLPAGTTGSDVSEGCCKDAFTAAPQEWTVATAMGVLAGDGDSFYYEDKLKSVDKTQFDEPWWFRSSFTLKDAERKSAGLILLHIHGVNYRSDVFVDGTQVGISDGIVGTFREFSLDITKALNSTSELHIVAFRVERPHNQWGSHSLNETDLAITFVDWNPEPPDSNMGIWQPVDIELIAKTGVVVSRPFLQTKLEFSDKGEITAANITVIAHLQNFDSSDQKGTLSVVLDGKEICSASGVSVKRGDSSTVVLDVARCPNLHIKNPKLWWPYLMGDPVLLPLNVSFSTDSGAKHVVSMDVGLREVTSELSADGKSRLYRINGRPMLMRGAGWTPDMFLRMNPTRYAQELAYVRHMNLNGVRLEGKFEHDEFYDIADRMGLLIMDGWSCGDAWERWPLWTEPVRFLGNESVRAQVRRLAAHPSVFVFLVGSDYHPPADIEAEWMQVFEEEYWPNEVLSSATGQVSDVTGKTGVKMTGPYSWVPPHYFMTDTTEEYGGAWGFLTEGGPGENPLRAGSIERVFAPEHQNHWPLNKSIWYYHCGNVVAKFSQLDFFIEPLEMRYGNVTSFEDFQRKAAASVYDSHRAMFEAYTRNRYNSTGVIHWMLNNAWPSNIWHLYDWYLNPTPGYFAARKGCSALHALYGYDDNSIYLVNNLWSPYTSASGHLTVRATVIDVDGSTVRSIKEITIDEPIKPDSTTKLFALNNLSSSESPVFIHLEILDGSSLLESNTYWLCAEMDVMDWPQSTFYNVPILKYADYRALQRLPETQLRVTVVHSSVKDSSRRQTTVYLRNVGSVIAFNVEVRLVVGNETILPVFWNDNYMSIPAGSDSVTLVAEYEASDAEAAAGRAKTDETPSVVVGGWNVGVLRSTN